ncbi:MULTISPECIES: sensor histidine kinase [unclassified Imperialibacter]|uniref:sensor histidine kinase n=1 Tax=unclassified Imperialibacter TaxID=2629706 RepID=UPI001255296B|nr:MULTISPECIES: histidine kinase [unclassified Imperialibacter]CAD5271056.1 Histidine kinase [Imperialibacter sp. 89]CAD5298594.1 Histidine kinase [Imperialibacter sp. 75]VVT34974.1 Histidine kinase [Imperialibacter sp. EC-SDR9]
MINKRRIYWICQIGGWSIYGFSNLFLLSTAKTLTLSDITGQIISTAFYILITHFLRILMIRRNWLGNSWPILIPKVIFATFLVGIIDYFFLLALQYSLGTLMKSDFSFETMSANVLISWTLTFIWALIYFTFHYFERYNKSLQFEATINEIELNNLKSQLNPHFIFNALNSIRALVDENPSKSKIAITQLSNILRYSLILDKKKLIPFQDELQTVKDYLALETIRFEERLKTEFQIHPDSYLYMVPPMMIQTLVENGIKHGVSNLKHGGHIKVTTEVKNNTLMVQIRNSGSYKNGVVSPNGGYGLQNTKRRLKLIYGSGASFEIANEGTNMVLTELKFPETI